MKRNILNCMVPLGCVCVYFCLTCLVEEVLEKYLLISLIMLYDYFVERGMRLIGDH